MIVKNKNNQTKKSLAINEVSILRQSRQAASLSVKYGSKQIIKKLVSDGVLVSTPAGSTAYNLSVHGPILRLNSKKLSIAPISPFRPRRWKGKIVNDKLKILITLKSNITHNLLGDRKRHLPFHGLKNNYNSLIGEKTELVVKKFQSTLDLTFQLRVCQRLLKNLVPWTSGQNKTATCSMRGTYSSYGNHLLRM